MNSIGKVLEEIRADRILMRLDEDNPICSGCERRFWPSLLSFAVPGFDEKVCAECCDEWEDPAYQSTDKPSGDLNPIHLPVVGSWLAMRWEGYYE